MVMFERIRVHCPGPRPSARRLTAAALVAAGAGIFVAGCEQGGAAEGQAALGGPPARPPVSVAVESAVVGPIATHYRTTATLEVEREAQIVSRVAGVIAAIKVEEGDLVQAGTPLLLIENEELRYRVEQATAKSQALAARLERMRTMSGDLVSEEEVETTRFDLDAAQADEGLARVQLEYTTVTAPFDGRITLRHVDVGQKVSLDTPLFALADFHPLLARVHVPAKEFRSLKVDQMVDLVLDSDGTALEGRIRLVSPVIDPQTGTIKVTIEVPEYPEDTRPGDFAEVKIVTEVHPKAVLVPKIAVLTEKGASAVWVVDGESVAQRVVQVGFTDDEHAEIVSGVAADEKIVVKGQRSLQPDSRVRVLDDTVVLLGDARP